MAKILFIQNIMAEYPGIMYLSAVLKDRGHKCSVVISTKTSDYLKAIKSEKPDIIAFSIMTGMHLWAIATAQELKKKVPDIKIIFGGVHPTYFPEIIEQPGVDIICRGEGELAILELMNALDSGSEILDIADLWVKEEGKIIKNDVRNLIGDLDEIPFMDRELYYEKYPFLKNKYPRPEGRGILC